MNLAEFPITLLTDRVPEGQKTLHYEDRNGRLTVTGSDDYGLPTAADADVIVALIQLTKNKNNFSDHVVTFTRYELIKILDWQDVGKSYHRLSESLHRWAGVTLRYQGTWWDSEKRRNVSVSMHILDTVVLHERTDNEDRPSPPLSSFTWNKTFLQSCQAGNLKSLNLGLYFSLKHPSSKRLYRFLDKRFNGRPNKPEHVFPLAELAITRVGLSPGYLKNVAKLKEKLQPAIDELEGRGFLRPMSRDERYVKEGKAWKVRFIQQPPALAAPPPARAAAEPDPPLVAELIKRGVTRATAAELVRQHPAETIRTKLDVFDWMIGKRDKRLARSPAGYLVKSITDDYAPPKGYVSRAERQACEEARQAKDRQEAEDRRRQREQAARERALREEVDAYLERLTPAEREALEAEALAQADPEARQAYDEAGTARFQAALRLGLVRE